MLRYTYIGCLVLLCREGGASSIEIMFVDPWRQNAEKRAEKRVSGEWGYLSILEVVVGDQGPEPKLRLHCSH
jgi:hypothetical protein